ncbi:hypothetical protein OSTOST_01539, partial [Ostertagia ostertagi]
MPLISTNPQQAESANSLKPQNACIEAPEQRDCCPPLLTPSSEPVQEPVNVDTVEPTPITSEMSSSCLPSNT